MATTSRGYVYAGRTGEKIGTIDNALVDGSGRFRYFVVDTGFWILAKESCTSRLLPN